MRIAFYAPLKSPDHPTPSGDRQMGRALIKAMQNLGAQVELVSQLRSFSKTPHDQVVFDQAESEITKIAERWRNKQPDIWFSYHPYYKAPDLLAVKLSEKFDLPIFTAEASLAAKRDQGEWAASQSHVKKLVRRAQANFYFTKRDEAGLREFVSPDQLTYLAPFIDLQVAPHSTPRDYKIGNSPVNLVTMGMMRGGVKLESYQMLAEALTRLKTSNWHLTIIGDGKGRGEVENLFSSFDDGKITWKGQVVPDKVADELNMGDIFAWPGFGEAYGLCYLEAQAAGLPVIAQDTAGVPSVVKNGETGVLVAQGDVAGFARQLDLLIFDEEKRKRFSDRAKEFITKERNLSTAQSVLQKAFAKWL